MKKTLLSIIQLLIVLTGISQTKNNQALKIITPAAYRTETYLPLLKNKRVGIFANHTATIGNTHLVDSLKKLGVKLVIAFAPEHGFRGKADAGETINNYIDSTSGIPVISLYGKKSRPSAADLKEVDVLLFDIQDVGVRFFTYISSLQDFIEAAIENNKPLIILDRPNPNGFFVDGPVLDTAYKSFVGMQPIPIVYGMTIGEYANMLIGEKWLSEQANKKSKSSHSNEKGFSLTVIKCANYTHNAKYMLPIKPSPNLPDMSSIYWYGSNCFFEGTTLSEGRGTDHPFAIIGSPKLPSSLYAFTPTSRSGATDPKLKGQLCYGWNLSGTQESVLKQIDNKIQIKWLIKAYQLYPDKEHFFLQSKSLKPTDYYFNKLAGNGSLKKQIIEGKTESEIKQTWKEELDKYLSRRKQYLIYKD